MPWRASRPSRASRLARARSSCWEPLPDEAWTRKYDGRNFADVDASIVGTHIMLAAHDLGLGTTWVGHFDAPAVKEAFPETAGYDLVALFPIGYPAADAAPSAAHLEHKSAEELVTRL